MRATGARLLTCCATLFAIGCSDTSTEPKQPIPAALALAGGAGQSGVVGTALPDPLVVKVTDTKGNAVPGTVVTWAVSSGGGSLSAASSSTDEAGLARVVWTLGTATGANAATATVSGLAPAAFAATAAADRPAVVRLSRDSIAFDALGDTLRLSAQATDRHGNVIDTPTLQWSSSDTAIARVDGQGLVTSRGSGVTIIRAVADTARGAAMVRIAQQVKSLSIRASRTSVGVGDTVRLRAVGIDARGMDVPGGTLTVSGWTSSSPLTASVDSIGLVRALAPGSVTMTALATAPGISGSISAKIDLEISADTGVSISTITPATLTPGATATITGSGFGATVGENSVTVAGIPVTVGAASASQLTVTLPPFAAFGCRPTDNVAVSVQTAGAAAARPHPLATAHQLPALDPGTYLNLTAASEVQCNELPQTGGSYLVSVYDISTTATAISAFRLRGAGGSQAAAAPDRLAAQRAVVSRSPGGAGAGAARLPDALSAARRQASAHAALLDKSRNLVARLGPPRRSAAGRAPGIAAAPQPLTEGAMLGLRVPNINGGGLCTNNIPVRARVVYAGPKAVVLEDSVAPLAGTMDTQYRALALEFEQSMLPVLEQNFGNPLAFDAALGNSGRILMLFSPTVNDLGGVDGFVWAGDFYPPDLCPTSNEAAIFYAVTPANAASAEGWHRSMRSTVIHEVKHITSNAERFARGASVLEESWLEEATAMLAMEIWGRQVFGYTYKGKTNYRASLYCEVRPGWPECGTPPFNMVKHFAWLSDYMNSTHTLSPLGRTGASDASFYGSGWLLVRWALDHNAGAAESAFLRALTQETNLSGVENLLARARKGFPQLLGPWSLSLFWDSPTAPGISHPSWDVYDIFQGLNRDLPISFPDPFPLSGWNANFGDFTGDVAQLRGGSAALFLLSGPQTGKQLLELQGYGGGAPAPTLRIAILRVQ